MATKRYAPPVPECNRPGFRRPEISLLPAVQQRLHRQRRTEVHEGRPAPRAA